MEFVGILLQIHIDNNVEETLQSIYQVTNFKNVGKIDFRNKRCQLILRVNNNVDLFIEKNFEYFDQLNNNLITENIDYIDKTYIYSWYNIISNVNIFNIFYNKNSKIINNVIKQENISETLLSYNYDASYMYFKDVFDTNCGSFCNENVVKNIGDFFQKLFDLSQIMPTYTFISTRELINKLKEAN